MVRADAFQLGRHGPVKGGVIAPVRSSSALVVSSTNARGERVVQQQPPISASGYSSQAFAPHFPHTVRKEETKGCTDCHLSEDGDNNAWMAQLLLLGTRFVNFVGYQAWVGGDGSVEAVTVTEWPEPQAVIGSYLQRMAYPDNFGDHRAGELRLRESKARDTQGRVGCLQQRGELLYVAEEGLGLQIYDISAIGNKAVSQPIVASRWAGGERMLVPTAEATCVALPTNQPVRPDLNRRPLILEDNQEQAMHPIYDYAVISDAQEGLVLVNVTALADGEPRKTTAWSGALTWNADGRLLGARHLLLGGSIAYVSTPEGVAVVDLSTPLRPRLLRFVPIPDARASALQFRYLWVTSGRGLELVDVTLPEQARLVEEGSCHCPTLARSTWHARWPTSQRGLRVWCWWTSSGRCSLRCCRASTGRGASTTPGTWWWARRTPRSSRTWQTARGAWRWCS